MRQTDDRSLQRWFADQPQPNAAEDFAHQLRTRLEREKTRSGYQRMLARLAAVLAVGLLVPAIELITLLAADAVLQVTEISLSITVDR